MNKGNLNKNDKNKKICEEINMNNDTGIKLDENEEDGKNINLKENNANNEK